MDVDLLRRWRGGGVVLPVTALSRPVLATAEKLPAPPQQTRSLEKRQKLLDAGRALFAQKGFEATSIHEITSHAETSAGAFYNYFRSKQQLLVVLMNELIDRLSKLDLRADGLIDGPAALRSFLIRIFHADLEYFGVIRAWQEGSLTDPELAALRARIDLWTEARILRVFETLQKRPGARFRRDLRLFARMMDRHFWSLLARGATIRRREFNREVKLAADVIYHYLFRDTDPLTPKRKARGERHPFRHS